MAHEITGKIVRYCVDNGKDLYQISKRDLQRFCDKVGEDVHDHLTVEHSIMKRDVPGGTAKNQVITSIREAKEELRRV